MRLIRILSLMFIATTILFAAQPAQAQKKSKYDDIPGISADQKQKILKLREDYDAKEEVYKEKKKEIEKEIKKLKREKTVNVDALMKAIEEHGKADIEKEKIQAKGEIEIRKLLTDKQRDYYDSKVMDK